MAHAMAKANEGDNTMNPKPFGVCFKSPSWTFKTQRHRGQSPLSVAKTSAFSKLRFSDAGIHARKTLLLAGAASSLLLGAPLRAEEVEEIPTDVELMLETLVEAGVVPKKKLPLIRETFFRKRKEYDLIRNVPPVPVATKMKNPVTMEQDLRLRYETISVNDSKAADGLTSRLRVRYRLGLSSMIEDNWKAKVRLATGSSSDPISTNQTFDSYFNRRDIRLETLQLSRNIKPFASLHLGQFANPTLSTQLLWDGDLTMTGAAYQWANTGLRFGEWLNAPSLTMEAYDMSFDKGTPDPMLYVAQAGIGFGTRTRFYAGYHVFDRQDSIATAVGRGTLTGNALTNTFSTTAVKALPEEYDLALSGSGSIKGKNSVTNDRFAYGTDFKPVDFLIERNWISNLRPGKILLHGVKNTGTGKKDKGLRAEVSLGELKLPRDWQMGYTFTRVQADAVVAAFNDSDMPATNIQGHKLSLGYQFSKNKSFNLTAYRFERLDNTLAPGTAGQDRPTNRLQFDVLSKF